MEGAAGQDGGVLARQIVVADLIVVGQESAKYQETLPVGLVGGQLEIAVDGLVGALEGLVQNRIEIIADFVFLAKSEIEIVE